MQAIAFIGHRGFEEMKIEGSIGLMNHLHIGIQEGDVVGPPRHCPHSEAAP